MSALDWEGLFANLSLDRMVDVFYLEINKCVANHVPSFNVNGKYSIYFRSDTIKTIIEKK